ncbi:MAG: hypothetical protein JAY85_03255 [Candidatus Thiodiazotropha weberae]|nr:hypothetical protein [Candidatus Thiodiazotropha weberae]
MKKTQQTNNIKPPSIYTIWLIIFNITLICCLFPKNTFANKTPHDFIGSPQNQGIYPEIKIGLRSYEYRAANTKVFDVNFPSIKIGLLGEYKTYFGQVYYERSLGDGDGNVEAEWDGRLGDSSKGNLGQVVNYTRSDSAVLSGVRFKPEIDWSKNIEFGFFGGYKRGVSKIEFKEYFNFELQETIEYEYNIDTEGPFAGLGFAIHIEQYGLLGIRGAYSWLDVDVSEKTKRLDSTIKSNYLGDGKGLSFGIAWIASLSQNLQYILEFDWHDYKYKDLKSDLSSLTDIDENQTTWRIGITYLIR